MTSLLKDIFKGNALLKNLSSLMLWDEVVSDTIKKHTKPIKIQRKTIYVSVDNSVWANELNYLKDDIIKKINEKSGEKVITDIKFKVGDIE